MTERTETNDKPKLTFREYVELLLQQVADKEWSELHDAAEANGLL